MRCRLQTVSGIGTITVMFGLAATPPNANFLADWQAWREHRIARLKDESSWLTLVGLHWLQAGDNTLVDLPGVYRVANGGVTLVNAGNPGVKLGDKPPERGTQLHSDADGKPDVLRLGSKSWYVIKRGERFALRVKDSQSELRQRFTGIDTFSPQPKWRIEARWEAYASPRPVQVPTVLGTVEPSQAPGRAHFVVDGTEYTLEPTQEAPEDALFFVFKDATSGHETYPAGRFLEAAPPQNGKVILDFNRAYNPPCAFTPFATCPLPTKENVLTLEVDAGEKRFGKH